MAVKQAYAQKHSANSLERKEVFRLSRSRYPIPSQHPLAHPSIPFRGEDSTYRFEILLNLTIQRPGLDSNNFRRSVRIMRYWATALAAKNAMNVLARRALAGPGFGGAGEGEGCFGDDCYQCYQKQTTLARGYILGGEDGRGNTVARTSLPLTVVAVIVARDERLVDGDGVCDGAAEAVAC